MTQTTTIPNRQSIGLQQQIATLRQEIGKPRVTRGRKVRAAAIRFEETFRGRVFNSEEFWNWLHAEPDMADYADNASEARNRLQAAGYRDDMPRSFEIVRVSKSAWELHAVERYILSTEIPEEIARAFKKTHLKMQHALQACDLDSLDMFQQYQIVVNYREFHRCEHIAQTAINGIQAVVSQIDGLVEKPAIENGEQESQP